MKQTKILCLLLVLCLTACGGETVEPSFSENESELVSEFEEEIDLPLEEDVVISGVWYEKGDLESENYYRFDEDHSAEIHMGESVREDVYTAYPMTTTGYSFENLPVGPDDVPYLSVVLENDPLGGVTLIEDEEAFLLREGLTDATYFIREDAADDSDVRSACLLMFRMWKSDEGFYLNFYPNRGVILFQMGEDGLVDQDTAKTGTWEVIGNAVRLSWDDGSQVDALLTPSDEDSTLQMAGLGFTFTNSVW